jgi:CRISPR/Cas system endoribonuclease Cas6 (RAMP superfamily)
MRDIWSWLEATGLFSVPFSVSVFNSAVSRYSDCGGRTAVFIGIVNIAYSFIEDWVTHSLNPLHLGND